jgi:hypothetical protein
MINQNGQDSRHYRFQLPIAIPWEKTGVHVMYMVPIPKKVELESKYFIECLVEDYSLGNLVNVHDRKLGGTKKKASKNKKASTN